MASGLRLSWLVLFISFAGFAACGDDGDGADDPGGSGKSGGRCNKVLILATATSSIRRNSKPRL